MRTVQIVAWCCWGGFVLAVVLISVFQMRKLRRREKGMRTWPHVQAVVVGHHAVPGVGSGDDPSTSPSYLSVYQYAGPDGRTYQGKTVWSKAKPLPVRQALTVCVNPGSPAESYPVEKTSRAVLGCMFVVMAAFCVGSFFFLRILVGT
ncbi:MULTISPECIES: DUF3592 domain-containing protein [Actinomycetes]|uniref:DUF3592 domain-containing protein n=1 Tax=Actinomycetes TaxID=1760 RepID=UPI0001B57548|nr:MULTISPECIES: DUF3592 domain-containing protein [Actinomycetes]EFL08046.1 predicted protein [Streptomyces sp. AA4]